MNRKPTFASRLILSLFMAILIASGATMLARSVRELNQSREAMAWPTAPGRIVRSEMQAHTQRVRRRSDDGIRRSSSEETFTAQIEYEFEVAGLAHKGNRLSAVQGGVLADKPHVQNTLNQYPLGQVVQVSYNPADPSQSVLEPGRWGGFGVWAGLSLFLIVLPGAMIWIAWHPKHSQIISGL
jgi:Protein of unknown function (DUF3592)